MTDVTDNNNNSSHSNNGALVMRVSKKTNGKSLASAISRELENSESHQVIVRAIGLPAITQACKGIIIAGSFAGQRGKYIITRMGFSNMKINDEEKEITAFDFHCYEQ